jgi:hypothetical protein
MKVVLPRGVEVVLSEELLDEFLVEWLEWVDDDAPKHKVMSRHSGLCLIFLVWLLNKHTPLVSFDYIKASATFMLDGVEVGTDVYAPGDSDPIWDAEVSVFKFMSTVFAKDGYDNSVPFDESLSVYHKECETGLAHTNESRVSWVRHRLEV